MGTLRNSYDYAKPPRIAAKDCRCAVCGGLIFKGEQYELGWHGKEPWDNGPDTLEERARRGCK